MALLEQLLSRTHAGAKAERELIATAFGIVDAVRQKAAAVKSDQRLSDVGRSAKLIEIVTDPWQRLTALRGKLSDMVVDIESKRRTMGPPKLDPSDAVGIGERVELRAILRDKSRAERLRLARDDNAFAVAALTAPPMASGFGEEPVVEGQPADLDLVLTAYQQRNHIELFTGLEMRQEAAAAVDSAIEHVTRQVCAEAGVSESEIRRLTTPADDADVDPSNLPTITRADLDGWSKTDPGRASAEMRRVFEGKAKLVDAA